MATSGIANFTLTRDEMIKASLRLLTELGVGESLVAEDYTNCNQALNLVLKSWQKKGAVLWTYQELSIPMVTGITTYPVGPTAGYLATAGITILTAGGGGTDGVYALTITDTTGTGAAGTYTIASGVLTAVTITVAGSGYSTSPVFSFPLGGLTTAPTVSCRVVGVTCPRPLRQIEAFLRTDASNQDIPLLMISRQEYDRLGNKTTVGNPNQYYYDNQLGNALVTFYNPPQDLTRTAHLIVQRQIQDMVSANDNFDLPQEWLHTVKWGLADELSIEYGAEQGIMDRIALRAKVLLDECFDFSVEEASVYFTVDNQMRQH